MLEQIPVAIFIGLAIFGVHLAAALLMQERRFSVKKTALLWGAAGIMIMLDICLYYSFIPSPTALPIAFMLAYVYYMATFIYVSSDGFWKKCYLWFTYGCVFSILWSSAIYFGFIFFPQAAEHTNYVVRTMFHIAIYIPLVFLYYRYVRPLIREVSGFYKKSWQTLCVISVMYFFVFLTLLNRIRLDDTIKSDTLIIFAVIVCTFAAVNLLSIKNIYHMRRESRYELVRQNVDYLMAHLENARKLEQESRRIRHDKRHHDELIAAMARSGDTDGILRYLGSQKERAGSVSSFCPHHMVNEILSSYAAKAKEAGIKYDACADTPAESPISDVDFVAILANLLENAQNACISLKSSGPITIHIKNIGEKTVFAVTNPCFPDMKLENGLPAARSIGINSILSSAARYCGEVSYSIDGNVCTACVILNP